MARTAAGKVHAFGNVPRVDIPRSTFNRSHRHLTTFDCDYLVPILVDEVLPGDSYRVNCHFFARLATPLFPIMDNLYLDTFFFFVPYRLLWTNWEKFCGAQDDPGDSISYTVPVVSSSGTIAAGDLADYMGWPIGLAGNDADISMSALPFRAYWQIINEWFRNQNLTDSFDTPVDDGPDSSAESGFDSVPRKRNKRHDYLTSCLPWPQKQTTAVEVPIGGLTDVRTASAAGAVVGIYSTDDSDHHALDADLSTVDVSAQVGANPEAGKMFVDLSTTTSAVDINQLRLAFQTQRLLERDARSGTRYVETILAHYGVTVPDFRAQRPEFLGGGSSPVNITPVAQTTYQGTPTDEDTKGALAGFGTVSGSHGFTKSFVEHGIIIGLANARGDITYSQGVERFWRRSTRYDFYYPVLSQIGEQSVLMSEIFWNAANPDSVWGYQERYAEYRYKPSRLTGLMSVDAASSLSAWHVSEDFSSEPSLGNAFIQANTADGLDRAIAVNTEPHFIGDFYFDMQCARPMPLYGVPGNLDHF